MDTGNSKSDHPAFALEARQSSSHHAGGIESQANGVAGAVVVADPPLPYAGKKRGRKPKALKEQMARAAAGLLMLAPQSQELQAAAAAAATNGAVPGSRPGVRGPRVKTVCRSTATGLPRATFSPKGLGARGDTTTDEDEDDLRSQKSCDSGDSDAIPVTDYIIMNHEREMRAERLAAGLPVDEDRGTAKLNGRPSGSKGSRRGRKPGSSSGRGRRKQDWSLGGSMVRKRQRKKQEPLAQLDEEEEDGDSEASERVNERTTPPSSGDRQHKAKAGGGEASPRTPSGKKALSFPSPKKKGGPASKSKTPSDAGSPTKKVRVCFSVCF